MNTSKLLLSLSMGAVLLCAAASPSFAQSAPAAEALAEIIAAYQTGSGVFADSDAPARAVSFDEAIAKASKAYSEDPTPARWSDYRAEVEKAARTACSLGLAHFSQSRAQGGDELFDLLQNATERQRLANGLNEKGGLYTHIERIVLCGNDSALRWKPRKKSASVALDKLLQAGNTDAARKAFRKLYDDVAASQAERFEGLGSELREIVDGLMP